MTKHERAISRLIVRAGPVVQQLHIDAIRADLFAQPSEAAEAWRKFQTALARLMVLSALHGNADAAREAIGAGADLQIDRDGNRAAVADLRVAKFDRLVDAVVGGVDEPTLFTIPFVEAVEAFAGEVPGLGDRLRDAVRIGSGLAEAIGKAEKAGSVIRGVSVGSASAQVRRMLAQVAAGRPITQADFAAKISKIEGISRARTDVIYRTNLMDGFNAGRYKQLRSVSAGIFPLYELLEIKDSRTRGNPQGLYPISKGYTPHFQVSGFVASSDDPIWRIIWPPNGWNCRATCNGMTAYRAKKLGLLHEDGTINSAAVESRNGNKRRLIESGSYPDAGFRGNGMISAM